MRQLVLDLLPETPPRFDNFVAGGNSETLTALAAWLAPENRESAFVLWGESGAGKTHLLRAAAAASAGVYVDAAADPELASLGRAVAFHAVDHVEALASAGEVALFNLFNRLREAGGRLCAACRLPPAQLALREDLRTRLGSGLIYRLHPLSDEEQRQALAEQSAARGLPLPPEAFDYLLARAPRDMRSLSALLIALDRYSLEHKRAPTLPMLRDVLRSPLPIFSGNDR